MFSHGLRQACLVEQRSDFSQCLAHHADGVSHAGSHDVPAPAKDLFSPSRASAQCLQLPFSNEFAHACLPAEVTPPMLFNGYYDKFSSFLSHTEPNLLLDSLQLIFEKLGCDCRPVPSEAKIEATQFVDFSMLAFDASVFTKNKSDDLYLVEISRRSGDCVKFSRFYAEMISLLRDTRPELIDIESMMRFESSSAAAAPVSTSTTPTPTCAQNVTTNEQSTASSKTPSSESVSEHITNESESPSESLFDSAAASAASLPAKPGLRRSPSSSRGGLREEEAAGAVLGLPASALLAQHDAHPCGPTKLSRDLFNSLLAFCRSRYCEQQRDGLELLARLAAHPVNQRALPRFARELLTTVSSLLPSHDLGVQHSACALISQVLAATRCDTKSLFSSSSSSTKGHSRSAPAEPRDSEVEGAAPPPPSPPPPASTSTTPESELVEDVEDVAALPVVEGDETPATDFVPQSPLDARSLFHNISDLLFVQSRHVRDVASEVLNCVATQSSEPELVKSPLYLTWLRQQLAVQDAGVCNRARSILARLGSS